MMNLFLDGSTKYLDLAILLLSSSGHIVARSPWLPKD
jgi:hypothetical protein